MADPEISKRGGGHRSHAIHLAIHTVDSACTVRLGRRKGGGGGGGHVVPYAGSATGEISKLIFYCIKSHSQGLHYLIELFST